MDKVALIKCSGYDIEEVEKAVCSKVLAAVMNCTLSML